MAIQSLSVKQLLALLRAARAHKERDWLMIVLGVNHGLRASEVIEIRGDDIEDGMLDVQRLKGSLHTIQPLVEHKNPLLNEKKAVMAFIEKLSGDERLFHCTRQTFWNIVQRHGETAGIPKRLRHPHILKHTIARLSIRKAGIENVRQYLGHKSMSSTGEYLKVTDEEASASVKRARRG